VLLVTAIGIHCAVIKFAARLDGGRNTIVLHVTAIVMHCTVM